jgi:outer membrane protein
MFLRRALAFAACLSSLSLAHAQASSARPDATGWRLGAIALLHDGGYVGNVDRSLVVPAVGYEGEQVYLRGLQLGWHAWRGEGVQLDLVAQARLDGLDARDIPIAGLQDRRKSMDVGAVLTLAGDAGTLEFTALGDALDRSGGQELALVYGYPFNAGRVRITPRIGVRWWSRALADYYYGIRPREVAQGAPAVFAVDSALIPELGLNLLVPLSRQWAFYGAWRYQHLPRGIADSPLVAKSTATTLLLGVSYAF